MALLKTGRTCFEGAEKVQLFKKFVFVFFFLIYLAASYLSCSIQDLHCLLLGSLLVSHGILVMLHGLTSCGTWA